MRRWRAASTCCSCATRTRATTRSCRRPDLPPRRQRPGAVHRQRPPDLARAADADGVHVGQDDGSVAEARAVVGAERIVGRSTHSPEQIAAVGAADYIAVGPVHATPTKPGRPAVGLEPPRRRARARARGSPSGIDRATVRRWRRARRVVVVRALTEADDPEAVARALRAVSCRGGGRWDGVAASGGRPRRRRGEGEACPAASPTATATEPERRASRAPSSATPTRGPSCRCGGPAAACRDRRRGDRARARHRRRRAPSVDPGSTARRRGSSPS